MFKNTLNPALTEPKSQFVFCKVLGMSSSSLVDTCKEYQIYKSKRNSYLHLSKQF